MRLNRILRASVTGLVALLRLTQSFSAAPVVLASCSVLVAVAPLGAATAEAKRSFDLPRGDAATTLRQFAAASGRSLVFATDKVRGTTTNAVRGEFTPRDALERMLAGSGLVATQDAATGAFVVSRQRSAETAPHPGEVGPVSDPQPKPKPSAMTSKPRTLLAALAGWLAAASAADAQTVATAPAEETVVLSPFTVSTDRDTGFVAASSLAGGRLAGELKDTPVAYSVITRDFIDALGITDISDAANWMPNSVTTISTVGGGYGNDASNDPGSFNVRGAGGGRGQRNFFTYNAPNDSYAVERYDMGRGPNAVLFGNGGLGGVASTTTKQARFDRPFVEISQLTGSWEKYRTTVDVNSPLGDRFAVRFAGVYGDSGGWRDQQFDKIKSVFLTGSVKLTRDTVIRVEGEYGETSRNQTFSNLTDRFSGWDGKTTYSGRISGGTSAIGVTRRPAGYLVYDPFSGQNAVMNYQNDPITMAGGENGQVPLAGYTYGSGASFGTSGANILYALNVPDGRFDNAIAGSAFRLPSTRFSLASDWPVLTERFRDLQVTIDHRFGNIFLQASADINRTDQRTYTMDVRNSNINFIDINRVLPNGESNPHFLQPYADALLRRNLNSRDSDGLRLAVGTFKDAGKWGYYTFNVMAGTTGGTSTNRALNYSIAQNTDHRRWGSSGNELTATDIMRIRRYWNEASRPFLTPASLRYIDPLTGVDRTIQPFWAQENDRADSLMDSKNRYSHGQAAINAKFFANRLVVLGAFRADNYSSENRQQIKAGDYSATDWDGVTGLYRPDAPDDYAKLTYIPKDTNGNPTGPAVSADTRPRDGNGNRLAQYANDRFKDDYNAPFVDKSKQTRSVGAIVHVTKWASPYVNFAQTYNPPAVVQLMDSSFPPASVANGIDIGIRFSLLQGRIKLNVLRYSNEELNSSVGAGNLSNINNLLACNAVDDTSSGGRNIRGVGNVPAIANDLRDREAKGYEVELVANVTRNLRLLFNVGLPKVHETNGNRLLRKYLDENMDILRQITIDAGCVVDANNNATVNTDIETSRRIDSSTAATQFNTLVAARQNMIVERRIVQDQPAVNFFGDYTFSRGRLRGLRVGAGVQYRGKQIIGYRGSDTIPNPNNPAVAIDNPNVSAYTPVFAPESYHSVVATMSYTWRMKNKREVRFDLRVNNVLDDQGPIYSASTVLRPLNGDFTSPARETVANNFAYKEPISFKLTTTMKF